MNAAIRFPTLRATQYEWVSFLLYCTLSKYAIAFVLSLDDCILSTIYRYHRDSSKMESKIENFHLEYMFFICSVYE